MRKLVEIPANYWPLLAQAHLALRMSRRGYLASNWALMTSAARLIGLEYSEAEAFSAVAARVENRLSELLAEITEELQ